MPLAAAESLVAAAGTVSERVRDGGRLLVVGGEEFRSDVEHLTVEFVHPVAGARSVAAFAIVGTAPESTHARLVALGRPGDVCVIFAAAASGRRDIDALELARAKGMTTIVFAANGEHSELAADHVISVERSGGETAKEWYVSAYHMLWELVQVLLAREPVAA